MRAARPAGGILREWPGIGFMAPDIGIFAGFIIIGIDLGLGTDTSVSHLLP